MVVILLEIEGHNFKNINKMTVETKSKLKIWSEHAFRLMVTAFITLVLITVPNYMSDFKTLSFDSIDDKVNTKNHVNNSLTYPELQDLKEHIGNPDLHMEKAVKDSLYVSRKAFEELVDRLSITNYQTKEQLREMNMLIRAINNKLR